MKFYINVADINETEICIWPSSYLRIAESFLIFQVEAELKDHGRSAEELAKYLIILKREMERHISEKRKFKEETKKASEENFKFENELDRLRRENQLKQVSKEPDV